MQILFTETFYAEVVYIVRYEVLFKVLSISKCKIKMKKIFSHENAYWARKSA